MHAHLLSEIDGRTFRPLLREITQTAPDFRPYGTWGELATALNGGRLKPPEEDALLAPLVARYERTGDGRWASILCASCFRWLVAGFRRRSAWHDDADEVWQESVATFLDVCRRVAARGRADRVRRQLVCQTQHRLHDAFSRRWRLESREATSSHAELPEEADPRAESRHWDDRIDLAEVQARRTAAYRAHRDAGVIADIDFEILVGTRLHGHTVSEEAARIGVTAACAKKRRQRAEAAIRKIEAVGATS